jgi:hypothetical protein
VFAPVSIVVAPVIGFAINRILGLVADTFVTPFGKLFAFASTTAFDFTLSALGRFALFAFALSSFVTCFGLGLLR